ncbi:related to YBT1 - Vacuolar, ABC protein transporting bile acids [Melanopsichium pennsylvanicum]|uniref:Related to YBT1 - Vacuolar, ABC protein transporting bile acids n=2 Tax=Melanopsichium pennsylvanicum TaxID=63383 RepID=A0AAJ4XQD0_9BASI|nr:related to YBT1-Vacuolar, ABC protein transporting bile acids [Melanopsichium pennsylvanicum 4]SNX87219.1 related to YBT1 - Vacuolar, ABC protein transporting bile acids [Melanopsichium pennsylvanicum]
MPSLPPIRLPPLDHYIIGAAALASTILIVLIFLLFEPSAPSSPDLSCRYTQLHSDTEVLHGDRSDLVEFVGKYEVDDYPVERRKALGSPIDAASYESRRLFLHIAIAVLAVVGLAINATAIVQCILIQHHDQVLSSTLYFSCTSAALRTLLVILAMLDLHLTESMRLVHLSFLSFAHLLSELLIFLMSYKLFLPTLGGDSNRILHYINVGTTLIAFALAFLSPCGPKIRVEATESISARNILRNSIGGGSVAQDLYGFLALAVVRRAYIKKRVDENDIPALDYTYRSAVVAEEMISTYRQCLADSLQKTPARTTRTNKIKAQALLRALIKCNAQELKKTGALLIITTLAFYVPKFGLGLLLDGLEKYEATLSGTDAVDTVAKRARATLIYSAIFYLTLFGESFIIYNYFRPLGVYLKTKVQTQLTTLLAWKRLRQKEASTPDNDASVVSSAAGQEAETSKQSEESATSSSQVINLVTTDVTRIFSRIDLYSFGLMGPLEVIVGGYSAYLLLGNGALIGLVVAALMQPIAFWVGKVTKKIDERLQSTRDRRVSLLSEAIRAIRMVKYEAWEDEMAAKIMLERRAELKCQAQSWVVFTVYGGLFAFVPMLTIVTAFAWYTLVEGNELKASTAFPAVAVLVELRFAVSYLPSNFLTVIQGWVSLKRIAGYLETGEVDIPEERYKPSFTNSNKGLATAGVGSVALQNAEITWPSTDVATRSTVDPLASNTLFTLSVQSATFETGSTNLVCGKIGSGKTLLLLSLLGEASLVSGSVTCPRSHPAASLHSNCLNSLATSSRRQWLIDPNLTAYAPQRPFLFNATVRANILFGLSYNPSRYRSVISACGLKPDLQILKDGDRTEIGESGTNLSGGQKARISLARAVYSHAGTVLIDDCLSALDSHTTKHVVEKLFGGDKSSGLLEGRTTILVTHHVRLMAPRCGKVLVLQEGKQAFFGSSDKFMESLFYERLESENDSDQSDNVETPNFGSNSSTRANSAKNSDDEGDGAVALESEISGSLDPANSSPGFNKNANASTFSTRATTIKRRRSTSAFSNMSGANDVPIDADEEGEAHKQISEEKRAQGRVSTAVYMGYIRAGGGMLLWLALLLAFSSNAFSDLGANWWLRLWASDSTRDHSTQWWLARWIAIQSFQVIAITLGYALVCASSLLAGSRLFAQLLGTVLRAPLGFHDSTPSGRLLNRFGKDMEAIDSNIAEELTEAAKAMLMAFAALVATWIGGGPIVIVILLFVAPIFYLLVATFTMAARDLKRLDSNAASKRITCFTDLITGVVTVRAFGSSSAYFATLMERLDENMMYYFWQATVRQWQTLLLGLASSGFVISSVMVVTLTPGFSAARAGFTLSFVQNLTSMLQYGLRSVSNVEQGLVAVERVMEYLDIQTEPLETAPEGVEEMAVPDDWPQQGAIEIRDLHLSYAENLPDVLDGISLSIQPGERVGIVGATGSGKSTLVSALFRFFEYNKGTIEIDGVDIGRIGLKTLRGRMKIVPQDPLILSGTLRSAVDPLNMYSDGDITRILVRVGLLKEKPPLIPCSGYGTFDSSSAPSAKIANRGEDSIGSSTLLSYESRAPTEGEPSDDSGTLTCLNSRIEENGSNLSSGQKQLVSLSRILISASSSSHGKAAPNSIVVLDESTSSIDYTTDAKIQSLLDSHFKTHNTTVLAIAHRLRSIINFDTVVVLNRGKVVEKGNPKELLEKEDGWFTRLAKSTGDDEFSSLKKLLGLLIT